MNEGRDEEVESKRRDPLFVDHLLSLSRERHTGEVKSLLRWKSDSREDLEEKPRREEGKEREIGWERKRHTREPKEDRGRIISPP